jgi:hypothetical protein
VRGLASSDALRKGFASSDASCEGLLLVGPAGRAYDIAAGAPY